jgi:hypothetical protein
MSTFDGNKCKTYQTDQAEILHSVSLQTIGSSYKTCFVFVHDQTKNISSPLLAHLCPMASVQTTSKGQSASECFIVTLELYK